MRHKGALVFGLSSVALFAAKAANAAMPPAGVIGNVATATYYDENNNQYTSTSNLVQTVVKQVYGVDVQEQVPTVDATPGQILNIPFTVTNTGNGLDTFDLNATTNSTYVTIEGIYLDANNNGVVDPGEESVDAVTLNMGETANVVVVASVSPDAPPGEQIAVTLNATSQGDPTKSDNATTTVNVVNDAVLQISMDVDKAIAYPGETLTYTVNFSNVGNFPANATDVTIDGSTKTGIIVYAHIPDDTTLVNGTVEGTPTGGTVVYSANGQDWTTTYDNATHKYVGYFIPDANPDDGVYEEVLAPDQQGSLIFKVVISDTPQDNIIPNNATIIYRLYNVDEVRNATSNTVITQIPAEATAYVDICCNQNKTNVPAGSWVTFQHVVTNNGTNPDTINLYTANENLPPGTIIEFWNADGSAKLIDTNGDGYVDVGELQPNENATITVKVFIPGDATNGTYSFDVVAASSINPDKTDSVTDQIIGIIQASVDIAKVGYAGDADPTNDNITLTDNGTNGIINIVYPGEAIILPFEVVNNGGSPDSYGLYVNNLNINGTTAQIYKDVNRDQKLDAGDVEVTGTDLLGGTTLAADASAGDTTVKVYNVANFVEGDVVIVGTDTANREIKEIASVDIDNNTITFTTPLDYDHPAGDKVSELFYGIVKIDVPPETLAHNDTIEIVANSTSSNTNDTMSAQYKVLEMYDVSVSPDNNGQIPPGGTLTYQHVVENLSNTPVTVQISIPTDTVLSYTLLDADKNPVGTSMNVTLDPLGGTNSTYTFYVKVIAPTTVEPGTVEAIQVNASIVDDQGNVLASDYATDTTTIISGYLQLTKYALDANCANEITEVFPGETICYKVEYRNIGTLNAYRVIITDPIPEYTTFNESGFDTNKGLCLDTDCDGVCDTALTNQAGDDQGEYNATLNQVVFRVGANATATEGGVVQPGEYGCVLFKVDVNK